jgi:hypothetical protein
VKLVSKLMIAFLLVAYVGQANASLFVACNAPDAMTAVSSHVMDMSQPSAHDNHTSDPFTGCEMSECECLEHACVGSNAVVTSSSNISLSAPNTKIHHFIPAWHNAERRSLFRPPIFA